MALEKYKVCPVCGEHNAPRLLECRKCETDLTGVKVVDSSTEVKQEENAPDAASEDLFRACDCGELNPPQARKCWACGEDISDIIPTKHAAQVPKPFSYKLTSLDGSFSVSIEESVIVVGRDAKLKDYLSSKAYVSRQHAKLTIVAGRVFIENISKTNQTFVNNEPIENNMPYTLKDGDEIGLGGKEIGGKRQDEAAFFRFGVQE